MRLIFKGLDSSRVTDSRWMHPLAGSDSFDCNDIPLSCSSLSLRSRARSRTSCALVPSMLNPISSSLRRLWCQRKYSRVSAQCEGICFASENISKCCICFSSVEPPLSAFPFCAAVVAHSPMLRATRDYSRAAPLFGCSFARRSSVRSLP